MQRPFSFAVPHGYKAKAGVKEKVFAGICYFAACGYALKEGVIARQSSRLLAKHTVCYLCFAFMWLLAARRKLEQSSAQQWWRLHSGLAAMMLPPAVSSLHRLVSAGVRSKAFGFIKGSEVLAFFGAVVQHISMEILLGGSLDTPQTPKARYLHWSWKIYQLSSLSDKILDQDISPLKVNSLPSDT